MLPSCSLLPGESHPSPILGADFGQSFPGTPVLELNSYLHILKAAKCNFMHHEKLVQEMAA